VTRAAIPHVAQQVSIHTQLFYSLSRGHTIQKEHKQADAATSAGQAPHNKVECGWCSRRGKHAAQH